MILGANFMLAKSLISIFHFSDGRAWPPPPPPTPHTRHRHYFHGSCSHRRNYYKDVDNSKLIISSNSGIIFRFLLIGLIGTVSIWANYGASKGFTIIIINDAGNSSPGKLFSFFYVSNDKATRIVLSTSQFIEKFLYPEDRHIQSQSHPKKQVNHVILRLATQNLTPKFSVESRKNHEYILHLSPSIMDKPNFNQVIVYAVQKGMSRIWLWDGHPTGLINGMIEYKSSLAGFSPELNSCHHAWQVAGIF